MKRSPKISLPPLRIDRGAPLPAQIATGLRDAIASAAFTPGRRLPSSRVLARALGVSRNTVLAAYEMLAAEGMIIGRVGSGTRVSPNAACVLKVFCCLSPEGKLRLREAGFPVNVTKLRDPDGNMLYLHC